MSDARVIFVARSDGTSGGEPPFSVTDTFNRANENPLSGGGNWASLPGADALQIISSEITSQDYDTAYMIYTGATFNSNQYSEITVSNSTGFNYNIGAIVRAAADGSQGYRVRSEGDSWTHIEKWYGGWGVSEDYSPPVSYTPQIGDVIGIEAEGDASSTTIRFYVNSTVRITWVDTSSPVTGGYPGVCMQDYDQRADNWEGGNL
jgi:hypothetical protein